MTEENNTPEAVDQAVDNIVANEPHEQQEQDNSNEQSNEQAQEEQLSAEEINWRKFREARERDRQQKEAAERAAKEKEDQVAALTAAVDRMMSQKGGDRLTATEQQKILDDLSEDTFATGGEIKGYMEKNLPKVVEQILRKQEEQRQEEQRKREVQEMPRMLRQEHPDFDNVVNQENLDYLDYHYPEIAGALSALPESKDKWSSVYKAVSKLVPSNGNNAAKRIDQNTQKPQAMAGSGSQVSTGAGPVGRMSEEQKRANYQRLLDLARQA